MSKTYDIAMKHIEDHFGPDWASILPKYIGLPPETRTEPIDSDLSVTESQADKLYRLSGPVTGLLHLELETGWAGEMPDRLLVYNVLAEHRHGGPVYSVVMLLRPESNSPSVTGELIRSNSRGEYLRFRYSVIRVWELSAAELMTGPIGLLLLALLTNDAKPRLPELVRHMDERVTRELGDTEDAHLMKTACMLLLGMRYDIPLVRQLFAGVTNMRESAGYQIILEEGEVHARHTLLLRLGRKRFGAPSSQVESRIKAINELDPLDRLFDNLDDAKSWEQLLDS
jgi:predicted transposase YdaD